MTAASTLESLTTRCTEPSTRTCVWSWSGHDLRGLRRRRTVSSNRTAKTGTRNTGRTPAALRGLSGVKGRDTIEIEHPPGEEIQWDWFERRNAPWEATAYVLLGTLPHSGKVRGVLAEKMDQAHLIEAIDEVLRVWAGRRGCGGLIAWRR